MLTFMGTTDLGLSISDNNVQFMINSETVIDIQKNNVTM